MSTLIEGSFAAPAAGALAIHTRPADERGSADSLLEIDGNAVSSDDAAAALAAQFGTADPVPSWHRVERDGRFLRYPDGRWHLDDVSLAEFAGLTSPQPLAAPRCEGAQVWVPEEELQDWEATGHPVPIAPCAANPEALDSEGRAYWCAPCIVHANEADRRDRTADEAQFVAEQATLAATGAGQSALFPTSTVFWVGPAHLAATPAGVRAGATAWPLWIPTPASLDDMPDGLLAAPGSLNRELAASIGGEVLDPPVEHLFTVPAAVPEAASTLPGTDGATASSTARRKPLAALMAKEFAALDWVVPGIMPEGVTLLVAPPKAGKSWLALDVALACATGGAAFGSIPVGDARPVLYLDFESGERRLQDRVRAQGWAEFGRFEYALDRTTAMEEIEAFVIDHAAERPLIVIDTLAAIQTDRPKERSSYSHDYQSLAQFQRFTRATPGAAVLIVHHTRKQVSGDPMDSVSGTNGLAGAVDTPMVLLRPDRHSPDGELNVMARDFEGGEFALKFEGCRWTIAGGALEGSRTAFAEREQERRKSALGPVKQGLLLILESDPREWTTAELLEAYDGEATPGRVRGAISELARDSLIGKSGRGAYLAITS